jgi:hypothetical protein
MLRFTLPCAYILGSTLLDSLASQDVVIPSACATLDGRSNGALAGFTQRFRMQVLLDERRLTGLRNRSLSSVAVRRDGQNPEALTGGLVQLVVRVSTTTRVPSDAQPAFSANEGTDVREVFRGTVAIPNAPALSDRNAATWQAPHAVEISFTSSFRYVSGTLCLDFEGSPVAGATSPWWPIDFDLMTHDGQVTSLGLGCDPAGKAMASGDGLLPGGSVRLMSVGPAGAVGIMMLSGVRFTPPLPLGFLGATGCVAHLLPDLSLGAAYAGHPQSGYAVAAAHLHLPNLPQLSGVSLYTQWLAFPSPINPARLSTTEGLELRLATSATPLAGVMVRTGPLRLGEPVPAAGLVRPHVVPVLCLRSQ